MKQEEWPDVVETTDDNEMPEGLKRMLESALSGSLDAIYSDMRKAVEKQRAFYERMERMGAKRRLLLRLAFCRHEGITPVLSDKEQKLYWSLLTPWQRFWRTVLETGIEVAYCMLPHSRRR